ncbi:EAL domain-containing protein [uncultured Lamprocystis sp.]|jgi:photoactive yellow protein|uniref:EAL domain-containing protein n=1 Tax=uncultured Lamprocystis sp. TaxID=543132 RepID=UPI0025EE312A|nr:EAL domain-containing protein [uncultured Lamprocystis sp.]
MNLDDAIDLHDPQHLDALSEEQLDQLPCGAIRVDAAGIILFYSRSQAEITNREPEAVIGRNFFSDVAPCTIVPEFYGRFRRGVLTGNLNTTFEFVFDFEMHPVQVCIAMRASNRPGEFWIVVEPLRRLPPRNEQTAYDLISGKFCETMAGLSAASFDFSLCDAEPIATCGLIQPFGCLLVVDPKTLRIDACSANTGMYLGLEPEQLLDAPVSRALTTGASELHACLGAAADPAAFAPSFFRVTTPVGELPLDVRLHRWRDRLLLEVEPCGEMAMDERLRGFDVEAFQQRLHACTDAVEVCGTAVATLRHLSGFERVVAYRFEAEDDGVVIAESLLPDAWPSILGLRYPATDIPRQARALYRETPLRYAPSRDHSDVPLLSRTLAPAAIDIGIAHVRAQSSIHRNYLKRFGVNGSMSLSIMFEERLWGLVIFHHRAPHPVTAATRRRLIELSGWLSTRLALVEERECNRASELGVAEVNRIVGEIDIEQPFPESFIGKEQLLCDLIGADAVQIYHHGQSMFIGHDCSLSAEETQELLVFLQTRPGPVWSTDCLSGEFEPAAIYPHRLAGVMVIFIDERREDMLVFGRRSTNYAVNWGANPASLPFTGGDGDRPFGWPNRVFQVWQEERTHYARPWSKVALATGLALKNLIQQVIVANAAHFKRLAQSLAHQGDQLRQSREEMRHRALHDALTGLPNRERFREALVEAIESSRHDGRTFSVALLDIDHFKTINDTLGHDKGDILLCALAERISAALPGDGLAARLGGDEFVLLLPQQPDDDPFTQAVRVVRSLRQPITVEGDTFSITCSLGLAIGGADSAPGELLKQADLALYRAKDEGRNCARPFDQNLETQALKRLEIDRALLGRSPIDAIEILLQPQLPIAAPSRQRRFEVLARWRTAAGDIIMPGDFIPAAERNGLIRSVTVAVLRQSIRLLRELLEQDSEGVLLAINVSAADLEARSFSGRLLADLHAADVPPDLIEIEITESLLLRMTPSVKASLHLLDQGGIKLSLDDFGTGFSSMAYLRELPISSLKIDREFIRGVETPRDRNLVAGMIAMAHSIGKEVVAEGIETQRQLTLLTELGCDWGQGYLWSRPVPPAQALATAWFETVFNE